MLEPRLITGDCRTVLSGLNQRSVHCVVTSPPYWGLRDYGVDDQIGLEETVDDYVRTLVDVFDKVRRVLRDDGTLWLNMGDAYAGSWGAQSRCQPNNYDHSTISGNQIKAAPITTLTGSTKHTPGLKPKDLIGLPWRVAFALQQPRYLGKIECETARVWLAAMVDAEGCIFIHKRKAGSSNGQGYERQNDNYAPGLEVSNTNRRVVERCLEITGLGSICRQEGGTFGRRQTLYRWNLRTTQCKDVLQELYPYLIAKQHEARLAISCPSSGRDAEKAHESLKAIHNGGEATIDFKAPESLFGKGWYLRSDIIWSKSNPMPSSVKDRPTTAHEYVFLLSKSERYYYDHEAIAEDAVGTSGGSSFGPQLKTPADEQRKNNGHKPRQYERPDYEKRNKRDVWTIPVQSYHEAHFATFPEKLVEPCILAGCPEEGTVLDPFSGSGTTGKVAIQYGRNYIGIELNPEYTAIAEKRFHQKRLFA